MQSTTTRMIGVAWRCEPQASQGQGRRRPQCPHHPPPDRGWSSPLSPLFELLPRGHTAENLVFYDPLWARTRSSPLFVILASSCHGAWTMPPSVSWSSGAPLGRKLAVPLATVSMRQVAQKLAMQGNDVDFGLGVSRRSQPFHDARTDGLGNSTSATEEELFKKRL